MQSMAVAGTDEFVRVNAALGKQLELNAGLLERAAGTKPFGAGMSMVPPGLQRPALPAAGQTLALVNLRQTLKKLLLRLFRRRQQARILLKTQRRC